MDRLEIVESLDKKQIEATMRRPSYGLVRFAPDDTSGREWTTGYTFDSGADSSTGFIFYPPLSADGRAFIQGSGVGRPLGIVSNPATGGQVDQGSFDRQPETYLEAVELLANEINRVREESFVAFEQIVEAVRSIAESFSMSVTVAMHELMARLEQFNEIFADAWEPKEPPKYDGRAGDSRSPPEGRFFSRLRGFRFGCIKPRSPPG